MHIRKSLGITLELLCIVIQQLSDVEIAITSHHSGATYMNRTSSDYGSGSD